jgi:hypothetical protein
LSASTTALDRGGDIGSQHGLGQDQDVAGEDNDYFPTIEELDREHALQRPNRRVRSRLLDAGDSQGRCFDLRGVR